MFFLHLVACAIGVEGRVLLGGIFVTMNNTKDIRVDNQRDNWSYISFSTWFIV